MNSGKYIFSQVIEFLPRYEYDKIVSKYKGDFHAKALNCYNQLLHLIFGQITSCSSLRDICLCLKAHQKSLYHLGFRQTVNESSLSRANEKRDHRIFEELGYVLIDIVRPKYQHKKVPNVYLPEYDLFALDSTSISVSVNMASWALGKYSRGCVKMHTLLDLHGSIPTLLSVSALEKISLRELLKEPNRLLESNQNVNERILFNF